MTSAAIGALSGPGWTPPTSGVGATDKAAGNVFSQALDSLQQTQTKADDLSVQAATQASVATDLTVAVRNQAVAAFNQVMQMPL